jgi:hypothetical protein
MTIPKVVILANARIQALLWMLGRAQHDKKALQRIHAYTHPPIHAYTHSRLYPSHSRIHASTRPRTTSPPSA